MLKTIIFFICIPVFLMSAEVTVQIQPGQAEVGPGNLLSVSLQLSNSNATNVSSYQLFLGYDAAALRAEEVAWSQDSVLSRESFASGIFDGQSADLFPMWRDGKGIDVVSVSGLLSENDQVPVHGNLCVINFLVLEPTLGPYTFQVDPGMPYGTFSGFFDSEGSTIPAVFTGGDVMFTEVPAVDNFKCSTEGVGLDLSWDLPVFSFDSIELRRDGALVDTLGGNETKYHVDKLLCGSYEFTVIPVQGGNQGPVRTCITVVKLQGPEFTSAFYNGEGILLEWSIPFGYSSIFLRRNGVFLVQLPGDAVTYEDTDLSQLAGDPKVEYELYGTLESCKSKEAIKLVELSVQQSNQFLRGDCNMDGKRSLADAMLLLSGLFAGEKLPCLDAADFDDNGKLQISDAVSLLSYLFASGEAPPPPFESVGSDQTEDSLGCG